MPIFRNSDRTIVRNGIQLDDSYIVPYNPELSVEFNAHINVEVVAGIAVVKYLYKYVYKGHDRAEGTINVNDEIQQYLDSRYVSSSEACWRILGFKMHNQYPTVERP